MSSLDSGTSSHHRQCLVHRPGVNEVTDLSLGSHRFNKGADNKPGVTRFPFHPNPNFIASQPDLYIPASRLHYQPPPPNEQTHRVFSSTVLGGDPPRRRRKSKECVGSTPPSRSKTLVFSIRVFVAVPPPCFRRGHGAGR
jgi:hypothetical protein